MTILSIFLFIFSELLAGLHNIGDFGIYYPAGDILASQYCQIPTYTTTHTQTQTAARHVWHPLVCFSLLMLLNFLSRSIHHFAAKSVKHMIQQTPGKPVIRTCRSSNFCLLCACAKETACICNTKQDIKYVFGSVCKAALKCLLDTEEVGVCLSLSPGERLVSGRDLAGQAGMPWTDRRPV